MWDALKEYDDANDITFNEGYDKGIKFCMGKVRDTIEDFRTCGLNLAVHEMELLYKRLQNELMRDDI